MPVRERLKRLIPKARDREISKERSPVPLAIERPEGEVTTPTSSSPVESPSLSLNNPWEAAYKSLQNTCPKLLLTYESGLSQAWQAGPIDDASESGPLSKLRPLIEHRLEELKKSRTTISVGHRDIVVREQLQRAVDLVISVKDVVSAAVSSEPHASLAWAGVLLLLNPITKAFNQENEAIEGFTQISDILIRYRVLEIQVFSTEIPNDPSSPDPHQELVVNIKKRIIELYTSILKYQIRLANHFSKSGLWRAFDDLSGCDDWNNLLQEINNTDRRINEALTDELRFVLKNKLGEIQDNMQKWLDLLNTTERTTTQNYRETVLSRLPTANEAAFNFSESQELTLCLEGTRVKALLDIQEWVQTSDKDCLYWLEGLPGTGKSTISRTVAEACRSCKPFTPGAPIMKDVCLGASFFFDHQKPSQNNAKLLFTTICSQLIEAFPESADPFYEAIGSCQHIVNQPFNEQWETLVLKPLARLPKRIPSPPTVVIVVDALDECQGKHLEAFVPLLSQAQNLTTIRLRILLTSRPEHHVQLLFQKMKKDSVCVKELQKIQSADGDGTQDSVDDIMRYLKHRFSKITAEHEEEDLSPEWPGESRIHDLATSAGGLFIYAATICRFLEDPNLDEDLLEDRLQMIFDNEVAQMAPQGTLDNIYSRILKSMTKNSANDRENDKIYNRFREVVGFSMLLFQPPSINDLSTLMATPPKRIKGTLKGLHSVLSVKDDHESPIQLLHLSFRDYLLDKSRSQQFHIEAKQSHQFILECCLRVLESSLKRDIFDLLNPSTLTSQIDTERLIKKIGTQTQYAAQYWVGHLQSAGHEPDDKGRVFQLLEKHFLHWLELASLLDNMTETIAAILSLFEYLHTLPRDGREKLCDFVYDMKRFAMKFRTVIETAPLQVYHSALTYSPERSKVYMRFKDDAPKAVLKRPAIQKEWGPLLQTLNCTEPASSLALSSDGKLIVTSSDAVCLWAAETGALIRRLENADSDIFAKPTAATITLDGTSIICIWTFEVIVWDVASGILLRDTPVPFTAIELSSSISEVVKFSDSRKFAAYALNASLFLVNTEDASAKRLESWPLSEFRGQRLSMLQDQFYALTFSPSDNLLASSLKHDYQIRIWNTGDFTLVTRIEDPAGRMLSIVELAFSPNEDDLLSISTDRTIRVWSVQMQRLLKEKHLCDGLLLISPRATHLIKGIQRFIKKIRIQNRLFSWDWSVQDVDAFVQFERALHMTQPIVSELGESTAFITGHEQNDIAVWNRQKNSLMILRDHSMFVSSLAFSTDNRLLVSGSWDTSVRLWDHNMHNQEMEFRSLRYPIDQVHVRPGGVVITVCQQQLGLWSSKTGTLQREIAKGCILQRTVMDGDLVAITSKSVAGPFPVVEIWQISPEKMVQTMPRTQVGGEAELSCAGSFLACETWSHSVSDIPAETEEMERDVQTGPRHLRIWDSHTGKELYTVQTDLKKIFAMRFSPNGRMIAVSGIVRCVHNDRDDDDDDDEGLEIWDVINLERLMTHSNHSLHSPTVGKRVKIAWSPDGTTVAFSGDDQFSVRILNVLSGEISESFSSDYVIHALEFSPDGQSLVTFEGTFFNAKTLILRDIRIGNRDSERREYIPLHFEPYTVLFKSPLLEFSTDGKTICTPIGRIDMRRFELNADYDGDLSLYLDGEWIVRGRERCLLVPPEYRGCCAAASTGNTLFMGDESGRLLSIVFDEL